MTMDHNLLTEPLFSWRDSRRERRMASLPGLLAKLAAGELNDFPCVRTHQFHPWSMFLAQLAAIAMRRAGITEPSKTEDEWREMLLALSEGQPEAWCLVADDYTKPAFMQPPIPEAKPGWRVQTEWSNRVYCPDEIDILVTAKAHDVKEARIVDGECAQLWIYALTTLQTMQGYPGRGYNAIARMKGGYGNRPRVGLAPHDQRIHSRWRRDVEVLLKTWPELVERGFNDQGTTLIWKEPWDGATTLGLSDLAPHFIEVCQRIRCFNYGKKIHGAYTTSKERRCLAHIENGDVGDPWIPLGKDGGALTVGPNGYHYELLAHLLIQDGYTPAAAQEIRPGDGDPIYFVASAMARGQGKTDGLHERTLVLNGEVRRRLFQPDERNALGKRSAAHIAQAKLMRSNVLFPALKALALGEKIVQDQFDSRVDENFFQKLFETVALDDEQAKLEWERCLIEIAKNEFQRAVARCALASAQKYRALAAAEARFNHGLYKHFTEAMKAKEINPSVNQGEKHD